MAYTENILSKANKEVPSDIYPGKFTTLEAWAICVGRALKKDPSNKDLKKLFLKYAVYIPEYIEQTFPDLFPLVKIKMDRTEKYRQKRQEVKNNEISMCEQFESVRSKKGSGLTVGFFMHEEGDPRGCVGYKALQGLNLDFLEFDTQKDPETVSAKRIAVFKALKKGDVFIIYDAKHFVKSVSNLIQVMKEFDQRGIYIKSLSDPWLDTTGESGDLIRQVFNGLSNLSFSLQMQKRDEGIEKARKSGTKFGRGLQQNADIDRAVEMYLNNIENYTIKKICEVNNISRTTLWRKLKELEIV